MMAGATVSGDTKVEPKEGWMHEMAKYEPVVQKPLPWAKNALEPHISEKLMNVHYDRHHATYVKNLNGLIEKANTALAKGDQQTFVDCAQAIKFNGGGHYNHEFFWDNLASPSEGGGKLPEKDSKLA